MAQSENAKKSGSNSQDKSATGTSQVHGSKQSGKTASKSAQPQKAQGRRKTTGDLPSWVAPVMSIIGVGVAVGASLFATRNQWMPKANAWKDDFSAAFADDETDYENFDQTRHAGLDSMRDHPGEDWGEIDEMSDASFPASDPPSFTPGTA